MDKFDLMSDNYMEAVDQHGARGSIVVKVICYKSEVAVSTPDKVSQFFSVLPASLSIGVYQKQKK
jgi:hypothetical protein